MLSRIPYFLLILICVIAVASTLANGDNSAKSISVAKDLLTDLQSGDVNAARKLLGDNTCNCPPTGGWIALLKYEYGHEPSMAFLTGQKFVTSDIKNQAAPSPRNYIFPWDRSENRKVDLNIGFVGNPPYFLPLQLAFGIPMTSTEFKQWRDTFFNEPHAHAFTLRLRNNLASGTIIQIKPDKREALLPAVLRPYVHPRDCAAVTDEHGAVIPVDSVAKLLPRLESVHASFSVVKRGLLSPWTIKSVKFSSPQWQVQ
jgi:hypothetical protein